LPRRIDEIFRILERQRQAKWRTAVNSE
jgi:hypothetical protein